MPELPDPISHTVEAIYRVYEEKADQERTYLGASVLGTECDRALWYKFRWAVEPERFDGRLKRLFATGHREEARIIADLRAAGMDVEETDPATGGQWAIHAIGGHLRGHLDGLVRGVPEAPKTVHVLECKTHNDKSFSALRRDGVERSKPGHYAQMQVYMHHRSLERALYVAVNKDTDALYAERVAYDASVALRLIARAERIILADVAVPRLHEDPNARAAYACAWCPAFSVCHDRRFARRNCRTCLSATPVVDQGDRGAWRCELHDKELSVAEQQAGCPSHRYLPSLVPGEQIDADEETRVITYRLADGSEWRDR